MPSIRARLSGPPTGGKEALGYIGSAVRLHTALEQQPGSHRFGDVGARMPVIEPIRSGDDLLGLRGQEAGSATPAVF